jgi:hypothetical protein
MSEDKRLRPICEIIEKLSNECNYFTDSTGSSTQRRLYASAVQNDNNMIHELAAQLRRHVMPLNTVLEVRVAEFVAIHDKDLDLWLKVMAILRSYYGDCHQRLALKLYLLAKNADNYPTLKRQLLTEAKTIAKYITPDLGQQTTGAMRSRAIHRYSECKTISDSLLNSTLLYLIESDLIDYKPYRISPNVGIHCDYKQRSRSSVTHNRNMRYRIFI